MSLSRALLPALLALLVAGPAVAQAADSLDALRDARREQARFEMLRRRNLPTTRGGGGGECDERIGRFCLTYDDEDDEGWVPPPEKPVVAKARARLIDQLSAAAASIPGDRWVTGQRVRYLVEARRFAEARAAAVECRAEPWWCAALAGAAAHFAGAAAAADSAFRASLAAMPEPVRAQWTDLSDVLEPELARYYRRLQGAARDAFATTYWGLADPFFSRPGNEVRSEHFARNLLDDLQDRAESADNLRWGSDLREILLRFGWPTGWERLERDRPYLSMESSYVSHYADSDRDILPPPEIFLDSAGVLAGDWDVEVPGSRSAYAVPLADSVVRWLPLDHQLARFYRGDSAVVVAAYRLPADSAPEGGMLEAALTTSADGLSFGPVTRVAGANVGAALSVRAPAAPMLASLELVMERAGRAARARAGLAATPLLPGRLAVSDLLLLEETVAPPETLEEAMRHARGSTRVRAGESLGVYWEVYGLEDRPAAELTMTLRIVTGSRGWLRRVAERARIVRGAEPVELRWREPLQPGAILGRALVVQIPAVPDGEYAIELSVAMGGAPPLVARQPIEVTAERE